MIPTRKITVSVPLDLYLQSRRLAAQYDTTVTAMVAHLLERMPKYLKAANYPVGGPKRPVRGPLELAGDDQPARLQAVTPRRAPPTLKNEREDLPTPAAVSRPTLPESVVSPLPTEAITAAVRLYDAPTIAESVP